LRAASTAASSTLGAGCATTPLTLSLYSSDLTTLSCLGSGKHELQGQKA
jgi:hypothetical protein